MSPDGSRRTFLRYCGAIRFRKDTLCNLIARFWMYRKERFCWVDKM